MRSKRAISLAVTALVLGVSCSGDPTPGGPCESTRDCVAGEVCVSGACTENPLQTDAGDVDGGITPKDSGTADSGNGSCSRDDQCGTQPQNVCEANVCVLGCNESGGQTCTGDTTCDPSGHCIDVNAPCTLDAECGPPSRICIDRACVPGCSDDPNLCAAGTEVCDANSGRCVPAPPPCSGDAECNAPATICEFSRCVPGCAQTGGLECSGQTPACNATTGRCMPAPPCQLDSQCTGTDQICVNTMCVVRCDRPGGIDCQDDVCNPNDGRCLPGDLPLGDETCVVDDQCATGICLGFTASNVSRMVCTDPCGASSQCPIDYNCTSVSGMGFCLSENVFSPPMTFDTPAGGSCTATANTCQSTWCNTGTMMCIETCSRNSDCTSFGGNCYTYTQDNAGVISYDNLCFAQPGSMNGVSCAANDNCMSGICNRYTTLCAAHCCTDGDCPAAESCTFYDLDTENIMKVCRARVGTGTIALGDPCSMPAQCESEVCVAGKCSTLCCNDADCAILPLGGSCRPGTTPIQTQIGGACIPN